MSDGHVQWKWFATVSIDSVQSSRVSFARVEAIHRSAQRRGLGLTTSTDVKDPRSIGNDLTGRAREALM